MVYKTLTSFPKGKHCQLCLTVKIDPEALGNICQTADVIVHYFCLLLASQIEQKGSDKQGLLGFFSRDIKKEIKRGSTLACSYCKKKGATVSCSGENCHMNFHVPCAQENGSLHQYFSEFKSFCEKHKPRQKLPPVLKKRRNLDCVLCCSRIIFNGKSYKDDPLWPACCKPETLLHKRCVQSFATSAGYYLKCPFCNNKADFLNGMKNFGIYIPEQEASWETEPNAYRELLERNVACVARTCICHRGRNYTIRNSKWHMELCALCGASGQHRGCFSEPIPPGTFECTVCSQVNARYTGSAALCEPEDEPEPSPISDREEVITEAVLQPVQENISKNTSMDCEEIVVISDSESEDINLKDVDDGTPALKNLRKRQLPARQEKRHQRKRQRLAECGAETSSQVCLIDEEENGSQMLHENDSSSLTTNSSTNHQQTCEINSQSTGIINEQPTSPPIANDDSNHTLFIAKVCTLSECNQAEINQLMGCDEVRREQGHSDQRNFGYINLVSDDEGEVLVISDTDAESSASSLLDSESSLLDLSEIPESEKSLLLDYFSSHDVDDHPKKSQKPKRKRKKKKVFTHTKKRKSVYSTPNNKGKSNKRSIESFNDKLVNKSPSSMKDSSSCVNTQNINDSSLSHSSIGQIVIPKENPISCTKEIVSIGTTNNKSLDGVASSFKNKKLIQSNDKNATVNSGSEINSLVLSKQNENETECFQNSKDTDIISPINENESLNKTESIENNLNISSCKNIHIDVSSCINTYETILDTAEVHLHSNDYELDNNSSLSKSLELPRNESCSLWCDSNLTVNKTPPYGTLFSDDSAMYMLSMNACEEVVKTNKSLMSDTIPVDLFQTGSNDAEVSNTTEICDSMAVKNESVNNTNNLSIDPGKITKVYSGKKNVESSLKRRTGAFSSKIDNSKILNTFSDNLKKLSRNGDEKLKILCSIPLEPPVGKIIHSVIKMNDLQHHLAPEGNDSEITIVPLAVKNSSSNCIVDSSDHSKIHLPIAVSVSKQVESESSKPITPVDMVESQPLQCGPLETRVDLQFSKVSPYQVPEENPAGMQMGSELLKFSSESQIKSQSKHTFAEVQLKLKSSKQSPAVQVVSLQLPKIYPPEDLAENRMILESSKLNLTENQKSLRPCKLISPEDEAGLLSSAHIPPEQGVESQSSKLNVLNLHSSNLNSPEKELKLNSVEKYMQLQSYKPKLVESQSSKVNLPNSQMSRKSCKLIPPEKDVQLVSAKLNLMKSQSSILNSAKEDGESESSKINLPKSRLSLESYKLRSAKNQVEAQSSKVNLPKSRLSLESYKLRSAKNQVEAQSSKVNLPKSRLSLESYKLRSAKNQVESQSSKVNLPKSRLSLESYKLRSAKNQVKSLSSKLIFAEDREESQLFNFISTEKVIDSQSSAHEGVKLQSSNVSVVDSQSSKLNLVETEVNAKSPNLNSAENEAYLQLSEGESSVISKLQLSEIKPYEVMVTFSSPTGKNFEDHLSPKCSSKVLELNTSKDLLKTKLLSSCDEMPNVRFNDSKLNANETVNGITVNKDTQYSLNNDPCCAVSSSCQERTPNWYDICKTDCTTCQNSTELIVKKLSQDISVNDYDFQCCAIENRLNTSNKLNASNSDICSLKIQKDLSVNYSSVLEQHSNITSSMELNDSQIKEMGKSDYVQNGYDSINCEVNKSLGNHKPLSKSFSKNVLFEGSGANCFQEKINKLEVKESVIDLPRSLESCTEEDETALEELLVSNLPDIVLSTEKRNSVPNFVLCNSSGNANNIKTDHDPTNKENKLSQNPLQEFNQSEIIENSEVSDTSLSKDQSALEHNNNRDILSKNIKIVETTEHYIDCKRQLNSLNEIEEAQSKNDPEKGKKQFVNCLNISPRSKKDDDSEIYMSTSIKITPDVMPLNKDYLVHKKHTSQMVGIDNQTSDTGENLSKSSNICTPIKSCDQKLFPHRGIHGKSRRLYSHSNEVFNVRVTYQKVNGNDEKPPLVSEIEILCVQNVPIFRRQLMEKFFFENEDKLVIFTDASGFQYVRLFVENIPQSIDCRIIFESEGNMSSYLKELIEYHRAVDIVTPQVVLIVCCNSTLHDRDIFHFLQLASTLNNIKLVVTTLVSEKTRVLKFNRKLIYYSQRYGYYVWDISKITFEIDMFRR